MTGSEDNKIFIWDLQSRAILQIIEGTLGGLFPFLSHRLFSFRPTHYRMEREVLMS